MELQTPQITPLLIDVINDNPTYDFPITSISTELYSLLLHQDEFEYFMLIMYRKLTQDYPKIFAETLIIIMETIFDIQTQHPDTLPVDVYQKKIDEFISKLEKTKITRVEKNSPDGQMLDILK